MCPAIENTSPPELPSMRQLSGVAQLQIPEVMESLNDAGAVLVRPTTWDALGFEAFTRELCDRFHNVGARAGLREGGDGYTTSTFAKNFSLLGHTEGTFRPNIDASHPEPIASRPPDLGFLFCEIAPTAPGGETILVDGIRMLAEMSPTLRDRFEREGIGYHMAWDPERWLNEFACEGRQQLEPLLRSVPGTSFEFKGDTLHLFYRTAAITRIRSGPLAFAPGALAHLPRIPGNVDPTRLIHAKSTNRVCFGNGEELSDDAVSHLIELNDALARPHRWRQGDLLIFDNTRILHGRTLTVTDCERKLRSRFGWLREALSR